MVGSTWCKLAMLLISFSGGTPWPPLVPDECDELRVSLRRMKLRAVVNGFDEAVCGDIVMDDSVAHDDVCRTLEGVDVTAHTAFARVHAH
jgi:hypothetical protein